MENKKSGIGMLDIMGFAKKLMTHPKGMKGAIPEILNPVMDQGEIKLKEYLDSIPLEADETECCITTQFDSDGKIHFVVSSFKGLSFSRPIGIYTKSELLTLLTNML